MLDRIPDVSEMFEVLEDDPQWSKIGEIHNELNSIFNKCFLELASAIKTNDSKDFPDYKYFLIKYLYRAIRIYYSIALLLIYGRWAESNILYRAFLENIVETKIFLNSKRGKAIRKLRLYTIINDIKYCEQSFKGYDENMAKYYGVLIKDDYINKIEDELRDDIKNGLADYTPDEIAKMTKRVMSGKSWHGKSIKEAFKDFKMVDELDAYSHSCTFVHVRDMNPFALVIEDDDADWLNKSKFCEVMNIFYEYINIFEKICNKTFSEVNFGAKKKDIDGVIFNLMKEIIEENINCKIGLCT
jgi:hypothetical protein